MANDWYRKLKGIPLDAPKMSHAEKSKKGARASPWGRYPMIDNKINQSWRNHPCRKCNKFCTAIDYDGNKVKDIYGKCQLQSILFGKPERCREYDTEAGVDG